MDTVTPEVATSQKLITALLQPRCYPHAVGHIELIETHISWVLLTGPYAYKIKKPVRFDFLDFATLEARRRCCEDEVRLNRRLAPDLYLDVVPIGGPREAPQIMGNGEVIEYAVRMRQFGQDALASQMLGLGALTPTLVVALAARIAAFHSSLPPAPAETPYGTPESVLHNAYDNFDQMHRMLASDENRRAIESLRSWTEREFIARSAQIQQRHAAGMVRECHGDLHLANVVLWNGTLIPFDCIEFNPALRWNDTMNELAFLMMDLMDRGASPLAWLFLNAYMETTGDYEGLAVLRFYLTYRAIVRAKIHLIRAQQSSVAADHSRLMSAYHAYMSLAERCTSIGFPAILLMHGFSGCGKSWLAQKLACELGAVCLRSDVERKRLHAMAPADRSESPLGQRLYAENATHATYERLAATARLIVAAGHAVIVDATFLKRWQRQLLNSIAEAAGVPIAVLSVQAPPEVLRARIVARQARGLDPSEATLEVLAHQYATAEAIASAESVPVIDVNGCDQDHHLLAPRVQSILGKSAPPDIHLRAGDGAPSRPAASA